MKWLKILALALQWIAIQSTKPEDSKNRKEDRLLNDMWELGRSLFTKEEVPTTVERALETADSFDDLLLRETKAASVTTTIKQTAQSTKEAFNGAFEES